MLSTCAFCSKEFKAAPSAKRKFCSHKCSTDAKIANKKECLNCGNEFIAVRKRVMYCSRDCYYTHNSRYKVGTSFSTLHEVTDETKRTLSNITKEQWKSGQFNDYLKKRRESTLRGKDHFNYKNGNGGIREKLYSLFEYKDWRSSVFKRDNFTCQKCRQKGGALEAHHKTSFREIAAKYQFKDHIEAAKCLELFDVSNGITLCKSCHGEVDPHRKRTLKKA